MNVDTEIPIPKKPIEILRSMSVGDSVLDEGATAANSKIYAVARKEPKRSGARFTARKVEGGLRIWRVE